MIPALKLKYPADRRSFSVRGEHAGTMDKTMRALFEAVMPVIIHFAGEAKYRPWYRDCGHPMKEEWFDVYRKTGWEDFVPGRCDLKPPLSFFTACRIRMVKKLLQSRYVAMLYTKYKFGFDVKPFRNKTV